MRTTTMVAVLATAAAYSCGATAGTVEEELAAIKARLNQLEQQVKAQNEVIKEKDRQITELKEKDRQITELVEDPRIRREPGSGAGWFDNVEIGGVIEVEASYTDPYEGDDESDVVLATAELAIAAQVNDWVAGEITLLYEEDETDLEVDVATIAIADPEAPWFIAAGQQYVPFGTFETNMISDPLTLEIGETRESSILGGIEANGFLAAAYVFAGDNKDDDDGPEIDNFGAVLGYSLENADFGFAANIGYINDIGDTDTLQDAIDSVKEHVPGVSVDATVTSGPFTLIGEYTAATDDFRNTELEFDGDGAEPSAFNIEAGYGFTIAGKEATFAIAYQGTDEALALELPETRIVGALSVEILKNTALAIEWAHDEDYDKSDGGTGKEADIVTAQLAVEF